MKIIIVRTVSKENRRLITSQFPGDWQIVIVSEEELKTKIKKLKLTKAYSHRLKQDFKDKLSEKDLDYLHTMRGDVVDLEFEAEEGDDYILASDGFYTNLRADLYPEADFDYVEKFWNLKDE